MKKIYFIVCMCTMTAFSHAQEKIYYVGHSLVNLDIPYMVQQIVTNAGIYGDYRHHINIGTGLKANWADTTYNGNDIWNPDSMMNIEYGSNHLRELLNPFQHIVITESVPLLPSNRDTSIKYGAHFFNLSATGNPSRKKYLYAVWEDDAHNIATWKPLIQSLIPEWEAIADGLATQSGSGPVNIVPGNIALLSLADSIEAGGFGSILSLSEFFNPDGIHLNKDGNYFIACLMAAVVYGVNPVGQPQVHSGPYRNISDSTITDTENRTKIQELAVVISCNYERSGVSGLCHTLGNPTVNAIQPDIHIYPNPVADNQLYIDSKVAQSYSLLNLNGQVLMRGSIQAGNNHIDVRPLSSGLYLIKIGHEIKKIIIQ